MPTISFLKYTHLLNLCKFFKIKRFYYRGFPYNPPILHCSLLLPRGKHHSEFEFLIFMAAFAFSLHIYNVCTPLQREFLI